MSGRFTLGIYHFSNERVYRWFDFTKMMLIIPAIKIEMCSRVIVMNSKALQNAIHSLYWTRQR